MTYDREGQNMEFMQREYIQPHPSLCSTKSYYLHNDCLRCYLSLF